MQRPCRLSGVLSHVWRQKNVSAPSWKDEKFEILKKFWRSSSQLLHRTPQHTQISELKMTAEKCNMVTMVTTHLSVTPWLRLMRGRLKSKSQTNSHCAKTTNLICKILELCSSGDLYRRNPRVFTFLQDFVLGWAEISLNLWEFGCLFSVVWATVAEEDKNMTYNLMYVLTRAVGVRQVGTTSWAVSKTICGSL